MTAFPDYASGGRIAIAEIADEIYNCDTNGLFTAHGNER